MNKKELVYTQLRKQIIECSLKPGLPINEADFANELGVSKTPFREAIRQLEREGLVSSVPSRGSIITYISSDDIYETFEIREIIECGAAERAAKLHDKSILIKKRQELTDMQQEAADNQQMRYAGYCDDIHLEIIEAVGNTRLLEMYRGILDSIERIRNNRGPRFNGNRMGNLIDEHVAILDSIIEGDENTARQMVREHLKNAYTYVVSMK
jgi:DNA-binding GntR family transcriptional regulator